ncbi:MAG TPA: PadR family transcriptional regulator [Gemmatimonadaceae bacterium]|nr:PadR family transcriptional regulator [Gemmatimonadaceae bacterium]
MPRAKAHEPEDLLRGTLDALVLKTLSWGDRHGYEIARWIKHVSGDTLTVEDRALYLALHRLEDRGLVESEWGLSENNRRARYYRLTGAGRAELRARTSHLTRYTQALLRVLGAAQWDAP